MKKPKAPFPIYSVSEFQRSPTCEHGAGCNPAESPAHHVLIDLTPEARAPIYQAGVYLAGEKNRHAQRIARKLAAILANAKEE